MRKVLWMSLATALMLAACGEDNQQENENVKEPVVAPVETEEEAKQESVQENPATEVKEEVVDKAETFAEPKEIEPAQQPMNNEELQRVIDDYMLGGDDKLISSAVDGEQLKIAVELGAGLFEPAFMASSSYSALSDELLQHNGWEVLIVEFVGIGTVRMDRGEREVNEIGLPYFPIAKIEERLNGN